MRNKYLQFLVGMVLGVVVIALIVFNTLLVWVATGPRSLARLTPYIAESLAYEGYYKIDIAESWLVWDGWRNPVDVRLRNVSVLTDNGQIFSVFPEISLGVDVIALFYGKLYPTSLTIKKPSISLFQNEDRSIQFGFNKPKEAEPIKTAPMLSLLAPVFNETKEGKFKRLRYVSIENADVTLGDMERKTMLEASGVNMELRYNRYSGTTQFSSDARMRYDEYESTVNAQFSWSVTDPKITGKIALGGIMPSSLGAIFNAPPILQSFNVPANAAAEITLDKEGNIERAQFNIEGGYGEIVSDQLAHSFPVSALSLEGLISNNFQDIQIDRLLLNSSGMAFSGAAVVSLQGSDAAIRAQAQLTGATAKDVSLVWPPALSPVSREWVTTNILEGKVPVAQADVNIAFGDLAKPALPKEAIKVDIAMEEGKIRYLPDHPPVNNVNGIIHIDGISLGADITSAAYFKSTKLSNGNLLIPDLNADNPRIKLDFAAQTSAEDAVALLALPKLNHAGKLNLNKESAQGTATVQAALEFDFFAPRDEQGNVIGEADIQYDVSAKLSDVSHDGFMKKFDIKNASGDLRVDMSGVYFKGKGNVNGASVSDGDVRYLFSPKDGLDTFIDVAATAPVEALPRFGYPAFPFIQGTLGVKASVKQGENAEYSKATLDLANASVSWNQVLSWHKPEKEPATFDIAAEKKGGVMELTSLVLKGQDADFKGSGKLTKDMNDIQQVALQKLTLGKTRLDTLDYEAIDGGFRIKAQGEKLDLTDYMKRDAGKPRSFSFQRFPAMQLSGNIGVLIMGAGREFTDVKGTLNCTAKICSAADISGKAGNTAFGAKILRNPKGGRQLAITAENAGLFLHALDVLDGMHGGTLSISGNYDDSGPYSALKGKLIVKDFGIKEAPVLAKILSLASLTGFFDMLQGNGIQFARLSAPFVLSNDVIALNDVKLRGPSIGMTAEGTITMPEILFDIRGTVVPAYALNSLLGKVPIVGAVLTGGEGGGVFAANYAVKGPEPDPSVTVNPLSILTPGFLRGLFEAQD